MLTVIVAENALDESTWTKHEVENIHEFLEERFKEHLPSSARIYAPADGRSISDECDVTPNDEPGIERLGRLPGPIFVVVYPEDAITVVATIAVVASIAAAFLMRPSIPNVQTPAQSPNNSLSSRTNSQRLGGRIPDIFGQVRSTPDLISVPYTVYEANSPVEYAYMCIGRGEYEILDCLDDTTPLSAVGSINGESVAVYGPYKSPNNSAPDLVFSDGTPFSAPVLAAKRCEPVNGQILHFPNQVFTNNVNKVGDYSYSDLLVFWVDGSGYGVLGIATSGEGASGQDFTQYFAAGQVVDVRVSFLSQFNGIVKLDGLYTIGKVTPTRLYLSGAKSVNPGWNNTPGWYQGVSDRNARSASGTIQGVEENWQGPFYLNDPGATHLYANFVAPEGLCYADRDDNSVQRALTVQLAVEVTPCDSQLNDVGPPVTKLVKMIGSTVLRNTVATTFSMPLPTTAAGGARCKVRVRVITPYDHPFDRSRYTFFQDKIQWTDLYTMTEVKTPHFGNVTTLMCRTQATRDVQNVKNRKLTLLVTRKVPALGTGPLVASASLRDVVPAICTDPFIGRRDISEIDVAGLAATVDIMNAYFGTNDCAVFEHTFDDDNLSFEETLSLVAQSCFCQAYRQGTLIKFSFIQKTADSVLLFNHRNKVPRTEKRSYTFGKVDDADGIELEFVDPRFFDIRDTFFVPEDRSATNPKKIHIPGVRSRLKARFLAYRAYNQLLNQNCTVEFEATQEAALLVFNDRILCSDSNRASTQDGEVVRQYGLQLELSQEIKFDQGKSYTIFLQCPDGRVDAIPVSPGAGPRRVVLARAPRIALSVNPDNYTNALAWVVADDDPSPQAFLVTGKTQQSAMTYTVQAVNYDDSYYANDQDYNRNICDPNGFVR